MLDIVQMILRLCIAIGLGAVMGVERGLVGKEAGVRTSMLVSGSSAIFTMIALTLPYLVSENPELFLTQSTVINIIANIIVGVGFLGAGIIIKTEGHVYGLTTAAAVWSTAAIGMLVGVGLIHFAIATTILFVGLLFLLRKFNVPDLVRDTGKNL